LLKRFTRLGKHGRVVVESLDEQTSVQTADQNSKMVLDSIVGSNSTRSLYVSATNHLNANILQPNTSQLPSHNASANHHHKTMTLGRNAFHRRSHPSQQRRVRSAASKKKRAAKLDHKLENQERRKKKTNEQDKRSPFGKESFLGERDSVEPGITKRPSTHLKR
jgi:hypothetical protein